MNCGDQHQQGTLAMPEHFRKRGRNQRLAGSLWLGVLSACLLSLIALGQDSKVDQGDAAQSQSQIAHGKYLVHHVAQCIQCHTPRDAQGDLIESRLLTGAEIPIVGPKFGPPWAAESVNIAGLGNYPESFVRHLLMHGTRPDGTKAKSPMPSFHLSAADAGAVVAYLKSL